MGQQYFYFVSGLPNQSLEDNKLVLTPEQFREQAKGQLSAGDYRLLELLHLPHDLDNLLHVLYKDNKPQSAEGLHDQEYWERYLQYLRSRVDNRELPCPVEFKYLPQFIASSILEVLTQEEMPAYTTTERELLSKFYAWAGKHKNAFIASWFSFDARLRNILLAISGRKLGIPYAPYLIGTNETTEKLANSHAADFGLTKEDELFEQLIRIYEQNNILYRERSYDVLRWKWIDDINFFNYFNIDRILGYYSKLRIEARWITADPEAGKKIFTDTLISLETSFTFPEDYNIKAPKKY